MAAFIAWFSSHSVGIAEVLAVVVAVDHALASSSFLHRQLHRSGAFHRNRNGGDLDRQLNPES